MMLPAVLFVYVYLLVVVAAEADPALAGTWVTKSQKVVTGPGFYDPIKDSLTEPSHTGISYSFTEDGYYEEAYYRTVPNPTEPSCPQGVMQFQHGKYSSEQNGTLVLVPLAEDGRQLISDPCKADKSVYYRYNQSETFKRYEVQMDAFHEVRRLDLYQFDGSPMNPMFLAYRTPQMLPTTTLNAAPSATGHTKTKRDGSASYIRAPSEYTLLKQGEDINRDFLWWIGFISISFGSIIIFFSWMGGV